ncbi:MAG: proteasome assembly chaperone family protein [Candidatus Anstonellales archaeon]
MKETTIIEKKKIKLKNGVLTTGLPGIGLVGRVACKYIVDKLKAEKIADLYSPHFPHQVLMNKKGGMRMLKNSFYVVKKSKRPFVVMLGDVQALTPEGQYELADAVIKYIKRIGINEIITIGGYSTGKVTETKRVFGAANNKKMIEKFKKMGVVFGEARGSIIGIAGVLPALAGLNRIDGICLMGETHGGYVDAASAKKVVELLSKYLGFKINLEELEKVAKEGEVAIKRIEEEVKKYMGGEQREISYIR